MQWRSVAHNVLLHLGSWLVDGIQQELTAMDAGLEFYAEYIVTEPDIVDIPTPPAPYVKFYLGTLVKRGARGFDGFSYYYGHDIRYLPQAALLAVPDANGDHFFRVAKRTSATVTVVSADYEFREEEPQNADHQWSVVAQDGYAVSDWPSSQYELAS